MENCVVLLLLILAFLSGISAGQCGSQAGGALCPNGLCCSKYGWCGSSDAYCRDSCQSQFNGGSTPTPPTPSMPRPPSGVGSAVMLAPSLPLCSLIRCLNIETITPALPMDSTPMMHSSLPPATFLDLEPPAILLLGNYNYGPCGRAFKQPLLNNPDLVATDPTVSFESAMWFWMTAQGNKPSCHDVITGKWTPSEADKEAGRVPGYGVITNIINGGVECGHGPDSRDEDRIGFYKRYCDILGVSYGNNVDCNDQKPFSRAILFCGWFLSKY
ncbi:hypothetical protein Nepgr_002088 [Nepenthes gracilis]|uniref:Chitin-binding type-1 domain-containing protein n=1 Tax=Nepenthes gracilis TaxID=150966 RepID=A0AAD3P978_NEPGR|nr:hypothetical protein Nepgr_002088 [Nepenthes gracilis]